jgi:beta-N-acetylhexosaminidase
MAGAATHRPLFMLQTSRFWMLGSLLLLLLQGTAHPTGPGARAGLALSQAGAGLNNAVSGTRAPGSGTQGLRRAPFWESPSPWADSVLASLSTEEKIGQLFMVAAYSNKGPDHEQFLLGLIRNQHIGGLIWFQGGPLRQVHRQNRLQAASKVPLLVGMDAEWGPSMRLDSTVRYPRQLGMGAIRDEQVVYRFGAEAARQLKALGVHISFSPVIDINNNPLNPVIGDRSFGEDRLNVALKGLAYMEGLQDHGVLACGKHFPGHGDTDADSHYELPVILHSRSRMDSVELYPFKVLMSQGLASVMTAHLHVPAYDARKNRAVSLSRTVSTELLRDSLGFAGLAITDALNMKGVSAHFAPGQLEVEAFLAGNDILLFPENVPAAAQALRSALQDGRISQAELDRRVHRILLAKAWAGLDRSRQVPSENLVASLNSEQALRVRREIVEQRLTLLGNPGAFLPFKTGLEPDLYLLDLGRSSASAFQRQMSELGQFPSAVIPRGSAASRYSEALQTAGAHAAVVIGLHGMSRSAKEQFGISQAELDLIRQLAARTRVVLVLFGSPYAAGYFEQVQHVLLAYDEQTEGQQAAARALFGQVPVRGRMPVSAGRALLPGAGVDLAANRLAPLPPGQEYFAASVLRQVDSIARRAMSLGATPGCRVLVARSGRIVLDRSYGIHSHPGQEKVKPSDAYDLASITKVAATTLAVMKLYDMGLFDLDAMVSDYLPELAGQPIGRAVWRDVLAHQARLQAWIPFYKYSLTPDKKLHPEYYRSEREGPFDVPVAEGIWMHRGWQDSIWRRIAQAPLLPSPQYKYSDLGFYLLGRLVETLSGRPLDAYVREEFYQPMGLVSTGFNPRDFLPLERIVPTERDVYYRHQLVHGYVHDMGAAMMGGVAGHAGLFGPADELAAIFQMLLNGGHYGGYRFLRPETVALFTARNSSQSRRGLGFDKPEPDSKKISPCSAECSPATFGHSGFTGTVVWADPRHELIYVFLSNRVYPDQNNKVLISENIRTKIQSVLYRALREKSWTEPAAEGQAGAELFGAP